MNFPISWFDVKDHMTDDEYGIEPRYGDIPKVFFGEALALNKIELKMPFRYISQTADISGWCKIKAQGNSTLGLPKKNQTIKLYKDADCKKKLKINLYGWGEQNKFCLKANWADHTHARNIVSARLWRDVVETRADFESLPEELRSSPNLGVIDGFPIKVYAEDNYQGRYTLNIPKDAWMANMDDDNEKHCILCGENYWSACFRGLANIDGTDWTDEVHDETPECIKTRWNEIISFVMNSTDDEFVTGIGEYFDVQSLIDYYCFGLSICNFDGFGKNQLYMTYDGLKWYAAVYDLDLTFGMSGSGLAKYFRPYDLPRSLYEDQYASYETRYGNLLYDRIEVLFSEQIKARYTELRLGALSVSNVIGEFEKFISICPQSLAAEDYAATTANGAFTDMPTDSTLQQIRDYKRNRDKYVDALFMGFDYGLRYDMGDEQKFNGVDDYIDTNINLYERYRDYAVFIDFTGAEKQVNTTDQYNTVLQMMRMWDDSSTGLRPGFELVTDGDYQLYMRNGSDAKPTYFKIPSVETNSSTRQRYVIQQDITAGTVTFYYVDADGTVQIGVQYELQENDAAYVTPYDTVTLGAYQRTTETGIIDRGFWTGIVHDFRMWKRPLSLDEVTSLLLNP